MKDWIDEAKSRWKLTNVKLNPGASIAEIEQTEKILDFKFPQDFIDLYVAVNGFNGLDWQEHMFTLWPLKMIIEEFDELEYNFVGFSDYCLKVNAIGFKKDEAGIFKYYPSITDSRPELIAQSFQEVVHMINSNHDLIY